MSKIKNSRLDQYGAGPFEHQQFGTAGVEGVKTRVENATGNVNRRSLYFVGKLLIKRLRYSTF